VLLASAGVLLSGHAAHAADPLGGDQAPFESTEQPAPSEAPLDEVDHARTADYAPNAQHANSADRAIEAEHADDATHAAHAENAGVAQHAEEAASAARADHAATADHASSVDEAATLSPDRCDVGDVLAQTADGWICAQMPAGGGEVLFAQEVRSPAYSYVYGNDRYYTAFGEVVDDGHPSTRVDGSVEAVEGVLPRDGVLANLFVVRTPGAGWWPTDEDPIGIRTRVTVFVNGAPTSLKVTHDSDEHGAGSVANLDLEVPVQAGDTVAFVIEEDGSSCGPAEDACRTHYNISLAFE
jgi:hypothetical protein